MAPKKDHSPEKHTRKASALAAYCAVVAASLGAAAAIGFLCLDCAARGPLAFL